MARFREGLTTESIECLFSRRRGSEEEKGREEEGRGKSFPLPLSSVSAASLSRCVRWCEGSYKGS